MAERRPTIADVARRVGVSKTLVSFVFNNRPGVASETRERILATAKEMGWRPRPRARSLSIRRSFALGLVLRRDASVLTADSFFPAFIAGVETVLADEGQVLVLSVVPEVTELGTYRTLARDHRVDGVILTDLRRDDTRLPLLVELGLPAVTLGRPDSALDFPCVDLDDRPGVEQTVEHLRALGSCADRLRRRGRGDVAWSASSRLLRGGDDRGRVERPAGRRYRLLGDGGGPRH